jgi:predicted TPR repeat methyltransferase
MGRMPNDHNPPGGISTRLVSLSDDPAELPGINDYDSFAEAYAAETEANLINGYYTRPAMLALAGDVAGRRILDAGCGAGPLLAALRDRGALVTGIDKSAGMLALARRRLGGDADLQLADLAARCRSPTARSTTSSRPWCCTTWRTGGRRWPSCDAYSSPAVG